jgi:HlyD family secretion protein
MRNKLLFGFVGVGLAGGFLSALVSTIKPKPAPPVFSPAPDPFMNGVYANGIVESYQDHGNNTNIYPYVSGPVTRIVVAEGQHVNEGDPLLEIDDSIQRASTEQLRAQADAARALLAELRAEPRKETLEVARAQVEVAEANLASTRSDLAKQQSSYKIDPRSVSRLALDSASNAANTAAANLHLAMRQLELTQAGAWSYDIQNQQHQVDSLTQSYVSAKALLDRYTVRAPRTGVVLQIQTSVGGYASPAGVYNPYTQQNDPIVVMGDDPGLLAVRCYIDEILVPRLPDASRLIATMFVRGTNVSVPLEIVRVQPYVTPKIELANARTEKVDLRVLPVIFRFRPPPGTSIYPGQLVDVYLADRATAKPAPPRAVEGPR